MSSIAILKKSRADLLGLITRIQNKTAALEDKDPITFDMGHLDRQITTINQRASEFQQLTNQIVVGAGNALNPEEERGVTEEFEENIEMTLTLVHRLMKLHTAHQSSSHFQDNLDDLERATTEHQDKDHSVTLAQLTSSFQSLRIAVNQTSVPSDHQLRATLKCFRGQLSTLSAEEKKPTIGTAAPHSKAIQLPKIALPQFEGDLMQWATFWSQFSAAVHSNPDLTSSNTLAYLRDAIRDPDTKPLVYSGIEHDGHYEEVVALLQRRFDKRRTIHSTYCRALACDHPVKTTKADLNSLADHISHNLARLKHTGQYEL